MSMLSAQMDELRELATRYDELQVGAVKAVTMPSNMGSILRDAADTIWELRDDLQRANAAVQDAEHDESMVWDRVRKAEAESAKLRELVARMAEALGIDCEWADPNWCKSPCVLEFGCWPEGDHAEIRCPAWATMRKLGIEVSK